MLTETDQQRIESLSEENLRLLAKMAVINRIVGGINRRAQILTGAVENGKFALAVLCLKDLHQYSSFKNADNLISTLTAGELIDILEGSAEAAKVLDDLQASENEEVTRMLNEFLKDHS